MKNKFSVLLVLLAFIMSISCLFGYTRKTVNADENDQSFKSKSVYLMDFDTKAVIFSKNEDERLPIASMCKIMTLLISFQAIQNGEISPNDQITVSENAANMGGSQVFLEANAHYSVENLLKSIIVASANDACLAIAEKLCGSEQNFVQKMNDTAQELGMKNTLFSNCTGLPKPGQYSSAKDVATMFSELLKFDEYYKYSNIWMDEISHPKERVTEISNTNKLIRFYKGCDGGKTGYTSEAGHCLAATAKRNSMRLVAVVISAPDSKTRFKEVSSMFDYGFSNYTNKLIIDNKKPLDLKIEICNGKKDTLEVVAERPVYLFTHNNKKRSVEIDFEPIEKLKAPINKGDIVGRIVIFENNIEIDSVNVLSNENISQKTYFDYIDNIIENWALF